jgi:hypothetical protein
MTTLLRFLRNRFVWSLPVFLGAVAYGAALLVAQEQEPGGDDKPRVSPATEVRSGGGGMESWSPLIQWDKPQGGKPDWLTRGENALRAREKMRRQLDQEGEFSFDNQPLVAVVAFISDKYGFEIHLDDRSLEEETLTREEPITIKTKGSLRSALQRILYPLNLDYVVHEDYLEITSQMSGNYNVLAYNLAHLASSNREGERIVSTIQRMVRPWEWQEDGGTAVCHLIGSVLLVKASERAHEEIETVLALLNTVRADEKK